MLCKLLWLTVSFTPEVPAALADLTLSADCISVRIKCVRKALFIMSTVSIIHAEFR